MDYVAWEVFVWALGITTVLFTTIIGYLFNKIKDVSIICDERIDASEERLKDMEKCHLENQVNLAKINKDIEFIKLQQQNISMKLDELLKKSWCKPNN
jgi:hypothetical protein